MTKGQVKEKEKQLLEITGAFCAQELNDEYFRLCEKLIKKMERKKNVPFTRGKLEIWAAAVVHVIGSINFLFDRSFKPYISSKQMNEYFGTKGTKVSNKARIIKDMFDLWYYSPEFSTSAMQENSPFNNMVMVDGLILPLNNFPENMQQIVLRARTEGKDIEFTTEYEDQ